MDGGARVPAARATKTEVSEDTSASAVVQHVAAAPSSFPPRHAARGCAVLLCFCAMMVGCPSVAAPPSSAAPRGLFAANLPGPTRLLLEVDPNRATRLVHLTTQHLPPTELESTRGTLGVGPGGRWCISPAPKGVEACLVRTSSRAVVLRGRDKTELRLDFVRDSPAP